jgi:hypothetical protein
MSDETPKAASFEADIKGLFRSLDVSSMKIERGFDLSKYEDVRSRADIILKRLEMGDMPCDGPWPAERIALFQKWISDGKLP